MLGLPSKFSRDGVHAAMNALVVAPGAEDDVGPALLGLFGDVEHLHAPGLEHAHGLGDVVGTHDHQVREVVGGDGLLPGRRHDEHVRETVRRHAVQADDAVLPLLFHRDAAAPDDRVAGTAGKRGELRLEPGGEDDAVELVFGAVGDRAVRRDSRNAAGAVDQRDVRVVEGEEVLVVEAGSLAPVPVVRLEHLRDGRIADERLDPRAVLLHYTEVELLDHPRDVTGIHPRFDDRVVQAGGVQRPTVVDEIGVDRTPDHHGAEVLHPLLLPTRPEVLGELLVSRPVAALADRRRRALEHVHVLRRLRERRHGLDAAGAHADDTDDLVGQVREVRIVRSTTRVLVVPPRRVERPALEAVHPRDRRQLHQVEDAGRVDEVARADLVAAVGADHPTRAALVPFARVDAGVEQRVVDQSVLRRDRVEVAPDLVAERVPRLRDVVHLLEHGHVDVRLDVAHHAGVAVPVPGAADATGLVDQHDLAQAGIAQLRPHDDARHPGAHDRHVDVLDHGFALGERGVGIAGVLREPLLVAEVVEDAAVLGHALGALFLVLLPYCLGIELGGRCHAGGLSVSLVARSCLIGRSSGAAGVASGGRAAWPAPGSGLASRDSLATIELGAIRRHRGRSARARAVVRCGRC